jgi:hypothetical protein
VNAGISEGRRPAFDKRSNALRQVGGTDYGAEECQREERDPSAHTSSISQSRARNAESIRG